MFYDPDPGENINTNPGVDTLTVTVDDQGEIGLGAALNDVQTVDISVGPVNDTPVNSVPGAARSARASRSSSGMGFSPDWRCNIWRVNGWRFSGPHCWRASIPKL